MKNKQTSDDLQREADREAARSTARIALFNGDVGEANRIMDAFSAKYYPPQPDFVLSDGGEAQRYILKRSYSDLPYPDNVRQSLAVELALGSPKIVNEILRITGGKFSCPSLEEFLRDNPCGQFTPIPIDEDEYEPGEVPVDTTFLPHSLAYMYAQHVTAEAAEARNLRILIEMAEDRILLGVDILPGVIRDCRICSHAKRRYRFSELDAMPRLPWHWGCACTYVSWSG